MNKDIEKMKELSTKIENLYNEILSNPDIPQEFKDLLLRNINKYEEFKQESKRKSEENKDREIIGYDPNTFEPIYKDIKI